jgi:peroxiredoxin
MKKLLCTLATIGLLFGLALSTSNAEVLVGAKVPDLTMTDWNGKAHTLSDYKGKYVVLEWFNAECPFVKKHYRSANMQALQKRYTDEGVVWLTVNSSATGKQGYLTPEAAHQKMTEWKGAQTTMILDSEGALGKAFGAKTTPHMYVINPTGEVIYAGAIDNNDSASESSIATAKNYVSKALDEAMGGTQVTESSTHPYGCSVKYGA